MRKNKLNLWGFYTNFFMPIEANMKILTEIVLKGD